MTRAVLSCYGLAKEGAVVEEASPKLVRQQMAGCIANGQAVFFVGAGMSAMAGHPTWEGLIQPLRAHLKLSPDDDASPALVAQFYVNQFGANSLYTQLRRTMASSPVRPTDAHQILCSLPASAFVTTNYDDLLESSLRWNNRPFHVIRDEAEMALWNEAAEVQVLKIHGDLSSAQSIVLTDWDYVRFLADKSLFRRKLGELFCYRDVIFIGYSLRDPNVSLIFNAISHELGNLKRPSYLITFEVDTYRQAEWRRRGMQPVCLAATETDDHATKSQLLHNFLHDLEREVNAMNRSVLIVDDDPAVRAACKRTLEAAIEGVRVDVAPDGLAAALLFGQRRPRLVIVDLGMPKLDGWEFIELVRQFASRESTKIIVFSGEPGQWSEKAEALGVDDFFTKADGFGHLQRRVKELLGIRPGYSGFPPSYDPEQTHWHPLVGPEVTPTPASARSFTARKP
jgi:CheY-like chemotaxis protein